MYNFVCAFVNVDPSGSARLPVFPLEAATIAPEFETRYTASYPKISFCELRNSFNGLAEAVAGAEDSVVSDSSDGVAGGISKPASGSAGAADVELPPFLSASAFCISDTPCTALSKYVLK